MSLSEKVALVVSVREEYSLTAALSALEIPTAFGMLERCAWKQCAVVRTERIATGGGRRSG